MDTCETDSRSAVQCIKEQFFSVMKRSRELYSMYGHTYSKSMGQPGKDANPTRGQLNRENQYFPVRVRA